MKKKQILKIVRTRNLKDGSSIIVTDMSKKLSTMLYNQALMNKELKVVDLTYQSRSGKMTLRECLIAAELVYLMKKSLEEFK